MWLEIYSKMWFFSKLSCLKSIWMHLSALLLITKWSHVIIAQILINGWGIKILMYCGFLNKINGAGLIYFILWVILLRVILSILILMHHLFGTRFYVCLLTKKFIFTFLFFYVYSLFFLFSKSHFMVSLLILEKITIIIWNRTFVFRMHRSVLGGPYNRFLFWFCLF